MGDATSNIFETGIDYYFIVEFFYGRETDINNYWILSGTIRLLKILSNPYISTKNCPGMFIVALFIITKNLKQHICLWTGEWIN